MKAAARKYLDWLGQQPCIKCHDTPVELAHVSGPLSMKTGLTMPRRKREAFYYALPVCPECHRHASDSIHEVSEPVFFDRLGVDKHQLVATFFCRFFEGA